MPTVSRRQILVPEMSSYILIVWLHFLGDFILQSDRMALNKSKSNYWLTQHAFAYIAPFLPLCRVYGGTGGMSYFLAVNVAAHWLVDWVTSRITAKLWAAGQRHWFFTCIGFDQAIHMTVLFLTFNWLVLK